MLPSRRRSRMELIREILQEGLKPKSKTKIMYRCNMNLQCFNRYMEELLSHGLLVKVKHQSSNGFFYKTTEKGKRLLKALDEIEKLLPS